MKKNDILTLIILSIISIVGIINTFIGFFNPYTLFAFILLMGIITFLVIGFQKNKSILEKDVIESIFIYILIYYFITYILGLFFGFVRNTYSLSLINIFKNTLPVILLIITQEVFRYIVNTRFKDRNKLLICSCISFIIISNTLTFSDLICTSSGITRWVEQLGLYVLPSVLTNVFVTYLSTKIGYKSSIIYRLLIEIPLYIIPIFPNFGNYIESVLRVSLPVIFIIWLYKYLEKRKKLDIIIVGKNIPKIIMRLCAFAFCIVIVYFVSGIFRYKAVVIASGSMEPKVKIGDVLIIDKAGKEKSMNVGDVLAYDSKGKIICHRIVRIIPSGKNLYYETKGDANKAPDQILVSKEDIIGVIKVKIGYIGYPSVLLNRIK